MKLFSSVSVVVALVAVASMATKVSATTFKYINADDTTVNSDWSLTCNGVNYGTVIQGTPSKPWVDTNDTFSGHACIKYQTPTYTDNLHERMENFLCRYNDPAGLNFTNGRYIGYALKLADAGGGFQRGAIITQCWQGAPWGPPVALVLGAGSSNPYPLDLCIRNITTGPDSSTPPLHVWNGSLAVGGWHTVVLYVKPRLDSTGEIALWIDGAKKVDWHGQIGYNDTPSPTPMTAFDTKFGIYQVGANYTHTLHFGEIRFGDSYASVNPGGGPIADGTYRLTPACAAGSRLDVRGAGTTKGTNVDIWGANGTNAQNWALTNKGGGLYTLSPLSSPGLVLDVAGAGTADYTNVDIWASNGTDAQLWAITPVSGGYTLAPQCAAGSRLDVYLAGSADGTNVDIDHANGTNAQTWAIN